MAVDMFLKIKGGKAVPEGESRDSKHPNEIDVLAWSWGISQSGTMHSGSGGGAGKANVQDLSFTTYFDNAVPTMMNAVCVGDHHDEATLVVRKAGTTPLEYITVVMTEVMVTSVSTGGSGGEDRLTANVTLNFAKVNVKYMKQSKDGSGKAGAEFTYDIAANEGK